MKKERTPRKLKKRIKKDRLKEFRKNVRHFVDVKLPSILEKYSIKE